MGKYAKSTAPTQEPTYFAQLEPVEHHQCRDYLYAQEIVRLERTLKPHLQPYPDEVPGLIESGELKQVRHTIRPENWLETRVNIIREAGQLKGKFTTQVRENPVWLNHPAARLVVLWSEWPRKDYFKISRKKRLQRFAAFSVFRETDRLVSRAELLNPHNPSTTKKAVISIAILGSATRREQQAAFDALLKLYAPELFKGAQAPQARQRGRGSEKARILEDLYAFAAYQLCRIKPSTETCHPTNLLPAGPSVRRTTSLQD